MSNPIEGAESVVTRGQNQLHIVAEEWQLAGDILEPLLDRLDPAVASTQLVILAGDAESAAGLSGRLVRAADERKLRTLAATDVRRAARVLKAGPAHVLVTHPAVLIDLTQRSSLKLDGARVVVLAWVDSLSASGTRALESVMAELPKDAARVVLAAHATPEVEQLVERYARRARRVLADGGETLSPVAVSYVTTAESGKLDVLRRVLDALDPDSATVVARLAASREAASALLRSLGYHDTTVRVASAADASASTVIFHDFPTDDNDVRRAGKARIVVLVTARQLASLRRMAGGTVTPFALPEAAARAQSREDALRAELRAVLETCQFGRELIALESLLADYDGSEIAAAALRLLETERAKPAGAPAAGGAAGVMTRLFISVGEMDQVRPGDLVGAITNQAGISRSELGRVDVRERHSTVEVATAVANTVVERVNGVTIRGRRALVKIDEERPPRPGRSDRPPRDRGDRPQRSPRPNSRPRR